MTAIIIVRTLGSKCKYGSTSPLPAEALTCAAPRDVPAKMQTVTARSMRRLNMQQISVDTHSNCTAALLSLHNYGVTGLQ